MLKLGIIGFGEAGYHITRGLKAGGAELRAYDSIAAMDSPRGEKLRQHARENRVALESSMEALLDWGELFLCLTSAASALPIAASAAGRLRAGQVYVDLNSTSPQTKGEMAAAFAGGEGLFVEGAVMSSVPANGSRVPIKLCGRGAEEASRRLNEIGMNTEPFGEAVGRASALKMLKSVLAKGMSALLTEAVFAADRYGLVEEMLSAIKATMIDEMGFERFCNYVVAQAGTHNARFCSEMQEVARMLEAMGENAVMAKAALEKFAWMKAQGYGERFAELPGSYRDVLAVKHEIENIKE